MNFESNGVLTPIALVTLTVTNDIDNKILLKILNEYEMMNEDFENEMIFELFCFFIFYARVHLYMQLNCHTRVVFNITTQNTQDTQETRGRPSGLPSPS